MNNAKFPDELNLATSLKLPLSGLVKNRKEAPVSAALVTLAFVYTSIAALSPALLVAEVPETELPNTIVPTLVLFGLLFGFTNAIVPSELAPVALKAPEKK